MFWQALEGKDVKDLLTNVGSGGGAAAVSSGGAAGGATGGAAAEEEKVEEKEEGKNSLLQYCRITLIIYREGRVRRGYGFRSFRLRDFWAFPSVSTLHGLGLSSYGATFGRKMCFHRMSIHG
jgi:hypothetical protein